MKRLFLPAVFLTIFSGMQSFAAFDYNQSVDEAAIDPLTAYHTLYLGMPRSDFSANFSVLSDWTFYSRPEALTEWAERSTVANDVKVTEGVSVYTETTAAKARVLAFENYFKTDKKKVAQAIYSRIIATIYAGVEDFPESQSGNQMTWVQKDITIVVSFDGKKADDGQYIVRIRRYNNSVLKA
ncbi:hypothetical protein [Megasphaera vaginalis (ex Bordigoni et al. 2020)]|uniref:hypothetical protein n=1 Tax=Megasphaera vaginalis (ex Bordigoni et al. 2020) TaxID=2045301 RepID=UPI000C7C51A6|nr:hypothetical protein [Megasphaera vaginalis (ex Bordigoni et al. 2020)]